MIETDNGFRSGDWVSYRGGKSAFKIVFRAFDNTLVTKSSTGVSGGCVTLSLVKFPVVVFINKEGGERGE